MKSQPILIAFLGTAAWSAVASAGIPEPDVILYGQVCIGGQPATAQDDVTIIAKATVGKESQEVGRYKMGDNPAATDCRGEDDCYVLRTRLESVPAGETPGGNAVVLDRANPTMVELLLVQGTGPEEQIAELAIADSGLIRRLDLRDTAASADLNGNGNTDLADYGLFRASFQGPSIVPVTSCTPADLNGDGYVDLRNMGILQAAFTGAGG